MSVFFHFQVLVCLKNLWTKELVYFYIFQIDRHVAGACHKYAYSLDCAEPASSRIVSSSSQVSIQPKITTSIRQSTEEAYMKMIRTAYTLALEPTLPSRQFKTLI